MVDLRGHSLAFDYPSVPRAVTGADLELTGDELVCILGPNGSGKSTLLRLLAGLLEPAEGRIELDGQPIADLAPRQRAREIALVPQALASIPAVTVHDFVLGGRYGHLGRWGRASANDHAAVLQALEVADASDIANRLLTQVSGGQRQRVLIARALAQQARALLVDEPTNSLDPGHQLSVFELIAREVREGHAVAVVTHDLNLASQFADRILLMNRGTIVAAGTPAEILEPSILEPVYGDSLRFGSWPGAAGTGERPYALPWRR